MAEQNFVSDVLRPALLEFAAANQGQFPADIHQLKPYFKSPAEEAVLQRWVVLPKSSLAPGLREQLNEEWFITERAPVNRALDQRTLCGLKSVHSFADGPPEYWDVAR